MKNTAQNCELVAVLAKLNKAFLNQKIQEGSFCELHVNAVSIQQVLRYEANCIPDIYPNFNFSSFCTYSSSLLVLSSGESIGFKRQQFFREYLTCFL